MRVPNSDIVIKSNQRVFIAGKTGSGKTTLAEVLLFNVPRLIVIDSKDGLQSWKLDTFNKSHLRLIEQDKPVRSRIVRDDIALEALETAYRAGNIVIYMDEVTAFITNPAPASVPQVVRDVWQRGRSRGIGAWAVSQQPVGVPLIFLREAEHFFMFRLNLDDDRKRMSGFMGDIVRTPIPDKYGFYYTTVDDNRTRYFKRLKI